MSNARLILCPAPQKLRTAHSGDANALEVAFGHRTLDIGENDPSRRDIRKSRPSTSQPWTGAAGSRTNACGPAQDQPSSASPGVARRKKIDRKSTRLNSSHSQISYAVFCLKKKKQFLEEHSPPDTRAPPILDESFIS